MSGMGRKNEEKSRILRDSGREMVIFLERWKQKRRRLRIYRWCLCAALLCGSMTLGTMGYLHLYDQVPSVLRIRAGAAQTLDLKVPLTGEVAAVSGQGDSNIPKGAVTIDLAREVTLRAGSQEGYRMSVKLFGFLPFKQVGIKVVEDQELIPVGVPVGIYVKAQGVLVIGTGEFVGEDGIRYSPAKYVLRSGDYILEADHVTVTGREQFIRLVDQSGGREMLLTVKRQDQQMEVRVRPEKDQAGDYKLGIWIRDDAQGVGTMTYIDREGHFGALGHGINDVDTSTLMEMEDGTLYQTEIISIKKGENGDPGEMTGMIVYNSDRVLGEITDNSVQGIFGDCNEKALELAARDPLPIALKQEITLGPAQILCTVDGETDYYNVEITDIHLDHDNVNRGIELRITDDTLLSLTGGIIQGMSGAPIIQNNRFIGAVTHVLVQDSTKGYGIFIENMLEH